MKKLDKRYIVWAVIVVFILVASGIYMTLKTKKNTGPISQTIETEKIFDGQAAICRWECTGQPDEKASYKFSYQSSLIVSDNGRGVTISDTNGPIANVSFIDLGEKPYSEDDYIKDRARALCSDCKDVVKTYSNKNIERTYSGSEHEWLFIKTPKPVFVVFEIIRKPFGDIERIAESFTVLNDEETTYNIPFKIGQKVGNFVAARIEYPKIGGYYVHFVGTTTVSGKFRDSGMFGSCFITDKADLSKVPVIPDENSFHSEFCFDNYADVVKTIDYSRNYKVTISDFKFAGEIPADSTHTAKFVKIVQ